MDNKPIILFVNAHNAFESLEYLLPTKMPDFRFIFAYTIEEAMEKIGLHKIDGMITHMQLPGLNEDSDLLGMIERDQNAGYQTYLVEDLMKSYGGIDLTKKIIEEFPENDHLVSQGLLKIPTIYFTGMSPEKEIETRLLHLHLMLKFKIIWLPVPSTELFDLVKQFFKIYFPQSS